MNRFVTISAVVIGLTLLGTYTLKAASPATAGIAYTDALHSPPLEGGSAEAAPAPGAPAKKLPVEILNLESSNRVISLLDTEIGESTIAAAEQLTKLSLASKDPIYVLLRSPGGSVVAGAAFLAAMEASRAPVVTVCVQFCASMAAIIHQYGTKRLIVNHSLLMFHQASGGLRGPLEQMNSRLNNISRLVNRPLYYIANRVGTPYNEFTARLANEYWLDGQEAVEKKFADGLAVVVPPANVQLNVPAGGEEERINVPTRRITIVPGNEDLPSLLDTLKSFR